jgi:hypothetical protein
MTGVPEWITNVFEAGRPAPPEAEESTKEELGDKPLLRGERAGGVPASATLATRGPEVEEGKAPKADMRLKGEYSPQLPEDIQDERQLLKQKELNFQEAQSFTRLNTGRALALTKAQAQEIYAEDYREMERLNKEYYSRWETENAQFRADIDAARALRVNPNNYMQSIGRSGRVSSVLATAVSQMAAGAGNPNQVWNRLKATIDQDITAQKNNIELEFSGIEAGQSQQVHEQNMLEKYYGFEEKSRAVAMYALEAQVGVIMQRASNEMEYQGYQMIRDRARAEAIDAAAAALAKNATLYLDAPTHRAYQALINAKRWQEAQAMLQQAYDMGEGTAQAVDTTIQSYDAEGRPVTFEDPAPAAPLGEVVEAPQPAAEAPAPVTPASRVAKDRRAAPEGPSPEEQAVIDTAADAQADIAADAAVDAAADRAPLTPAQAEAQLKMERATEVTQAPTPLLTPEETAERDKEREVLRRTAAAAQVEAGIVQRMGADVIAKGGYRFQELEREGMKPQGFNTFLEARDIILDPDNPEIAVFASYEDAKEGRKYDARTGPRAAYERKNVELYEDYTFLEHEGTKTKPRWIESNYVETGWGRIKLTRTSTMRADQALRDEFRKKVNKDFIRAEDIHAQAKAIVQHGTGSIFGLSIGPDGITLMSDEGASEAELQRQSGQIGLGIQAMKQLDPSGRLTDKDIDVGKQYMTALLQDRSIKVIDTFSSIYRNIMGKDPTKSDMRRVLKKTLAKMATKLSDAVAKEHVGDIVFDYDQNNQLRKGGMDVENFLTAEEKRER